MNRPVVATIMFLCAYAFGNGQAPPAPPPSQLTPQVLAEMLRSATNFHDLVQNLNLNKSLGPDVHTIGPDGASQHSIERTAATIGAGAGIGVAIGSMTRRQNGVLLGAFIGGAGGLIVDEILKHREETHPKPLDIPPPPPQEPRQFKQRP